MAIRIQCMKCQEQEKWHGVWWKFRGERNVFLPISLCLKPHLELEYMFCSTVWTFPHTEILIRWDFTSILWSFGIPWSLQSEVDS